MLSLRGTLQAWAPLVLVACGGVTQGLPATTTEAGSDAADASLDSPAPDAQACVQILASSFDTSCQTSADCYAIASGTFCGPSCLCPNATINVSGVKRYTSLVTQIDPANCNCLGNPFPQCLGGQCTLCAGSSPDPPGCSVTVEAGVDAAACVTIDPTKFDQLCMSDSDCTLVTAGTVCTGGCACETGPVATVAAPSVDALLATVSPEACPCAPPLDEARCVQHTCTLCPLGGGGGPAGCPDGG